MIYVATSTIFIRAGVRRYFASRSQVQDIYQKTGESFRKINEPISSPFYKASGHPNLSTADGQNSTATHSREILERGIKIGTTFLSLQDIKNVKHTQYEILRANSLNCIDYTEKELEQFDYLELKRWAYLAHFRKNFPIEYCKLQTDIKQSLAKNTHWNEKQKFEEIQYKTDFCLYDKYQHEGFQFPYNSPVWSQIL